MISLRRPANVTGRVWTKVRGCWAKRTFPNRKAAKRYGKAFKQRPYLCTEGNHWHLTSRPKRA
jgi:hypothetical protein